MIGGDRSTPQMAAALRTLTAGTERLLNDSLALAPQVINMRLALEIGVIQTYAAKILAMLKTPRSAARARPPEQMGDHGLRADKPRRRASAPRRPQARPVGTGFASLT